MWGGLWELPTVEEDTAGGPIRTKISPRELARMVQVLYGYTGRVEPRPFCDFRRLLSHRTIRFVGYIFRVESRGDGRRMKGGIRASSEAVLPLVPSDARSTPSRWLPLRDLDSPGMSRAMQAVVEYLKKRMADG